MRRFGSDPEDAAPAAVLRALHRRGVGTLLRVTTSPSHVALTVAVSGGRCTLVFTTTPDAPPRDVPTTSATSSSSTDWTSPRASPSFRAGFCNIEHDDRGDETREASR